MRPNRSALILATTLVVAACGTRPEPLPPTSTPPVQAASPRASATPQAGTSDGPSETPFLPSVPRLTWTRLGDSADLGSLLPWQFSDGYLAIGGIPSDPEDDWGVWFSPDGRTWDVSPLSTTITPCSGWVPRASTTGSVGWAAGGGAVVLGLEHIPGGEPCGQERIVAWRSGDGRDWTRSSDFGSTDLLGYPIAVWAVEDRWEAALSEHTGATTIWTSAGGNRWERIATISEDELDSLGPVLVGRDDGRRVAAFRWGESTGNGLIASTDGRSWQPVEALPLEATEHESLFVKPVLAPDGSAPFWLVTAEFEEDRLRTVVLTSRDLISWEQATFPMPVLASAVHTPDGIIAVGADPCRDTGTACPNVPPVSFISRDGLSWEPIPAPTGPTSFAEGPSGVIGLGGGATWTLTRYTDDQAFLLEGIRADAREACTVRDELPAGAVAGIECTPSGGPADRIGAYLFSSQETMLSAYFGRLADEGISPERGGCPRTPGDAAYVSTTSDPASEPHRTGCFINEFGVANYRITYPESQVYVGALGRDRDLAALGAWVWEGNLDTPGSPTIWREGQAAAGS